MKCLFPSVCRKLGLWTARVGLVAVHSVVIFSVVAAFSCRLCATLSCRGRVYPPCPADPSAVPYRPWEARPDTLTLLALSWGPYFAFNEG